MKIFVIHHAGGSSLSYINLKKSLDKKGIDCILMDLPGHGKQLQKDLLFQFDTAVGFLAREIKNSIADEEEFSLLGISLGGVLAYHVERRLELAYGKMAKCIFLMGCIAPDSNPNPFKINPNEKDRKKFIQQVSNIGGIPEELMESPDLLDVFYPVLRADFKLLDSYVQCEPVEENKVKSNLIFMEGDKDRILTKDDSEKWKVYTIGKYKAYKFSGHHFFYNEHLNEVCKVVHDALM